MSNQRPAVSFGTVTIIIVERQNTPPPYLVHVPNPYVRHAAHPLLAEHIPLDDAVAMMIRFTRDLANRTPGLFLPFEDDL